MATTTNNKEREMYLDYVNNFLTVSRFAEYYGITEKRANKIINKQRAVNNILSLTNQ